MPTILLVEDELIIALAEAGSLRAFGYAVRTATTGEAAVAETCREGSDVDLVLMDIDLGPGIDGTEAARRILEKRQLPIVFLSAHSEREQVEKVRGVTRYGYVIKNSGDFVLKSSIEMAFELFGAHERTRASEARLNSLLKTIPDLVWLKDEAGVYLACNPAFERFYGAREADIVGKTDYDFVDRELADFFRAKDRAAIELGAPSVNEEWVSFAEDGRRALLETIKTPTFEPSGRLVGVLGISRDITERKRMEEALKESEFRVRRKLDALIEPEGELGELGLSDIVDIPVLGALMEDFSALTGMVVAILDMRGKVLVAAGWQNICTKFHRVKPESAEACTESDLFLSAKLRPGEHADYRCENNLWDIVTPLYIGEEHVGNIYSGQFFYEEDRVDRAFFEAQAERYGYDREAYLAALDRVPRYSHERIERLMRYLVTLTGFVSRLSYANLKLARTMTERQRTEELLSKSVAEKEILLKELSHRMKNSLNLVSSLLSLNMANLGDEGSRRAFQESIDRLRSVGMIYEELSVSKSSGELSLARYLKDLAELLLYSYAERGGRVRLSTSLEDLACDPKRAISLGLVLNELLTNALKYAYPPATSPDGGEIRIGLARDGEGAELRVEDDGPGLGPGFDLKRVQSLGLRLASLLAEELGGSLSFEEGLGTRAVLKFPLAGF